MSRRDEVQEAVRIAWESRRVIHTARRDALRLVFRAAIDAGHIPREEAWWCMEAETDASAYHTARATGASHEVAQVEAAHARKATRKFVRNRIEVADP